MIDRRLVACAVVSIAGHVALARGLERLPHREAAPAPRATVEIRVVPPAPPPPEAPPPEVPPPDPAPAERAHEPAKRPVRRVLSATTSAASEAPVVAPAPAEDPSARPVFGVSMESTSQAGSTVAPVGNTLDPAPRGGGEPSNAPTAVAAAADVTKMPMPHGRCAGAYTDTARAAGIEGTVVLDLVVDEHGRARDVTVVSALSHGLTEAAVSALRACRFSPGEKAGIAVPVRIRGFKIRFLLQDGS